MSPITSPLVAFVWPGVEPPTLLLAAATSSSPASADTTTAAPIRLLSLMLRFILVLLWMPRSGGVCRPCAHFADVADLPGPAGFGTDRGRGARILGPLQEPVLDDASVLERVLWPGDELPARRRLSEHRSDDGLVDLQNVAGVRGNTETARCSMLCDLQPFGDTADARAVDLHYADGVSGDEARERVVRVDAFAGGDVARGRSLQ